MADMQTGALIAISLALAIAAMAGLAVWARKRSKGALMTGAFLSLFAPDPTLEAQVKLTEESKQTRVEEDEEGEPH
jgi:hypothetical protein